MNQREESQYSIEQRINQDEQPSTGRQVVVAFAFLGVIVGLPSLIGWLGKNIKIK